jgi:multiple sugar transport system ATP-binding protein
MNFLDAKVVDGGVATDHFTVDGDLRGVEGVDRDDPVSLGVRPEDIYPASKRADADAPSAPIETTVDVLEPMGKEIFAYLLLDETGAEGVVRDSEASSDDQLLMSVDPDSDIERGQTVEVVLDRTGVHLFDAEGDAVVHGVASLDEGSGPPPSGDSRAETGTD